MQLYRFCDVIFDLLNFGLNWWLFLSWKLLHMKVVRVATPQLPNSRPKFNFLQTPRISIHHACSSPSDRKHVSEITWKIEVLILVIRFWVAFNLVFFDILKFSAIFVGSKLTSLNVWILLEILCCPWTANTGSRFNARSSFPIKLAYNYGLVSPRILFYICVFYIITR